MSSWNWYGILRDRNYCRLNFHFVNTRSSIWHLVILHLKTEIAELYFQPSWQSHRAWFSFVPGFSVSGNCCVLLNAIGDLWLACSIYYKELILQYSDWQFFICRDPKVSRDRLVHLVLPARKDLQETQVLREKGENRSINNLNVSYTTNYYWAGMIVFITDVIFLNLI